MTVIEVMGKQVDVGDQFLKLAPELQQHTVQQIAEQIQSGSSSGSAAPPEDIGQGRSEGVQFLRGVPIAGAYADKAAAALNAAAEPVMDTGLSKASTFSERMSENERRIKSGADEYARTHPIASTVEQFAGGSAALAPLAASGVAARALGMSGTLPQMVTRGAASGAGIGAVDEAARGGSPIHGAEVGAITGAGFPVAGRAIGSAVRAIRGNPAPRTMPTENINGVDVPQFESSRTGDNLAGSQEQAALSGASGPEAQRIAQEAFDARAAATEQARLKFGQELSPATNPALGAPPDAAPMRPHEAGDQAITELAQQHNDEVQRRALSGIANEVSDTQLRSSVNPAQPPTQLPPSAYEATQAAGEAIGQRAQQAAATRTGAYNYAGDTEGTYNPAGFERVSNSLENRLNQGPGDQRVRVNDLTPRTREGLQMIESEIGSGRVPTNEASSRVSNYNDLLNAGTPTRPIPPITPRDVESVRQQLVALQRDANNAARAPGGSYADARGVRRLTEAFDAHVRDVIQAGGFSGDGAELLRRYDAARAAHANYRGNFSARGQGDTVGPVIEKIIGKHPGQAMVPDQIATAAYGPAANPGGGNTVAVAQRFRTILGPDSPEWGQMKQGMLSHLLDNPHGTAPMTPMEQADRIYNFVNGKGGATAQVYFSPEEIGRLTAHADQLRALVPHRGPLTSVDKQIMKLSGADGHPPATSRDLVDMVMTGDATKGSGDKLLQRLKTTLSPESWDGIRQGVYEHLTTKPEGMIEFGPQAISNRLAKFLDDPISSTLYSPKELQMMRVIQREYEKQIPLANTTNPSGSGVLASKMLRAAQGNLLPLLGLATHGPVGVIAGMGGNKALAFVSGRRAANKTRDLFYGKAPKAASNPNYERAAAIIAKAALPLAAPNGQ